MPALAALLALSLVSAQRLQPYPFPFGITVSLPAKPVKQPSPDGMPSTYMATADGVVYVIAHLDLTKQAGDTPLDQQLAAATVGYMESQPGKLLHYKNILLNGWPGVEFKIKGSQVTSVVRNYCVNNRFFSVGITSINEIPLPAFSHQVLDSVFLNRQIKAGPETTTELTFQPLKIEGLPFSVELPGTATDQPKTIDEAGSSATLHRYTVQKDLRQWIFAYASIPEDQQELWRKDADKAKELIIDSILRGIGGEPSNVKLETRDGKEWSTATGKLGEFGLAKIEVLFADGYVVVLLCGGPGPWTEGADFKHMFDSFKWSG